MNEKIIKIASSLSKDPFSAAKNCGVTVLYSDLPESTKGLCYTVKGNKIILINSALSDRESRYVCAHELGHALLHPDLNIQFLITSTYFSPEKYEKEADTFAAYLLLDKNMYLSPEYKNMTFAQLSKITGYPEKLFKIIK